MFSPVAIASVTTAAIRANVGPTHILFVTGRISCKKTGYSLLRAYKYEAEKRASWRGQAVLAH